MPISTRALLAVLAFTASCHRGSSGASEATRPSDAIEAECGGRDGQPMPYRTAKQLVTQLAGRWAACGSPTGPRAGVEYTADGKWFALAYQEGTGWVRVTTGRKEDQGGVYKIVVHGGALDSLGGKPDASCSHSVPLDDDRQMADDFFVMTNIGRPSALVAFESSPKRMVSISYGHAARFVAIP